MKYVVTAVMRKELGLVHKITNRHPGNMAKGPSYRYSEK